MRRLLGLESLALKASPQAILAAMKGALCAAEKADPGRLPGLCALSAEMHLSALDQEILLFAALAKMDGLFQAGLRVMGKVRSRGEVLALTATCLGTGPDEVAAALARESVLTAVGLVTIETQGYGHDLDDWLETAPDLLTRLLEPDLSVATLLASYLKAGGEAPRALADFSHLAGAIALVRPLLGRAAQGERGINVLFYGPPGTGKTALARSLAADLTMRLLEVAVTDRNDGALTPRGRARALRLVTHLAAHGQRGIVLFDEVEDYFREDYPVPGSEERIGIGKGFSIDLLEQAASPVIWIGNRIDDIDPALLRRFSLACEIPPPPKAVRARLAAEYLTPLGLADHPLARRLARYEGLVPGLLAQAARTTRLAAIDDGASRAEYCAQALNGLLAALGQPALPARDAVLSHYDAAFVNADCDLAALSAGIGRQGCARVLCVGAPGTGKSAWARHLAEALGRPLLAYRASDLLDPYVGMSERRMAGMFARARAQRAVLLLDECESFLRSRAGARHHWEVTQVNEMLTQMDGFEGIFVATTNAGEALDEAVYRRFDRLVTFRPLAPGQRHALVMRILRDHGLSGLSPEEAGLLDQCEGLTVGDVAAVLEGLRLEEIWTAGGLVRAIHTARRARGERRGMGFMAAVS